MTLANYRNAFIEINPSGYGHWTAKIQVRKSAKIVTTTDARAIDRINSQSEVSDRTELYGYTLKQAYAAIYSELK